MKMRTSKNKNLSNAHETISFHRVVALNITVDQVVS